MKATFYLHIGVQKTGTTSIQQTMFKNRDALLAQGINYLPFDANHGGFLISLLSEKPHKERRNIRRYVDTPEKAASYNASNRERLTQVLSGNQSPKILISGEGLSLIPEEDVRRLKQMFDPYAAAYRVVVYARDPYEFANSASLQRIKSGATLANAGPPPLPKYRRKIQKYLDIFGRENVDIRIFDPRHFVGGDLISDFLVALGEPAELKDRLQIRRANQSISHEAAMIMSEANIAIPAQVDGIANRARAFGFHVRVGDIKGEKFSIDPNVYLQREDAVLADLDWLHRIIGEPVFGRATPRAASHARWSQATLTSIRDLVADMASTIRQLQATRSTSFWRSFFSRRPKVSWRFRVKKDFSQALSPDLNDIVLPASLEWLREAIGQPGQPEARSAAAPHFDQATIRDLACFLHSLSLTIERLKAERAEPTGRRLGGRGE
jgi:hypothetical protein